MLAITPARPVDVLAILRLMREMDAYYGDVSSDSDEVRSAQIGQHIYGATPSATAILARDGEDVIGLATYSFVWPAHGTTRSLYLKEMYVLPQWRGKQVGRHLMAAVEKIARDSGCSRLEFTTDRSNLDAQAFYARLGHVPHDAKLFYRKELL